MTEYNELIHDYVAQNLSTVLLIPSAGSNVNPKYVEINEHMLRDAEYRNQLINIIANHIICHIGIYYKPNLDSELSKKHFLESAKKCFGLNQLVLLAEYYDKKLANVETVKAATRK